MTESLTRRQFTTVAAVIAATGPFVRSAPSGAASAKPVRVGFVGVGGRGAGMLRYSLGIKGVHVPAVCDINAARAGNAANMVARRSEASRDVCQGRHRL